MQKNSEFEFDEEIYERTVKKYKMDEAEAVSYKIQLLWLEKSIKYFPDCNYGKLKKGDPRKSLVFKICYKLVRETAGLLDPENYELYIQAQLDVLKIMSKKHFVQIDAGCLVGEKAWRRWNIWKKKYDESSRRPNQVSFVVAPATAKAIFGLESTFNFFNKNLGKIPNFEELKKIHQENNLFLWINFGKVSPYYLVLSPFCKKIITEMEYNRLKFDPEVYKPSIDEKVVGRFKELFPEEGSLL